MIIYDGKAVFEGIAIGKISVYTKQEQLVKRIKVDDPEAEKKRYADAREVAIEQLKGLYEKDIVMENNGKWYVYDIFFAQYLSGK